MDKNDLAYSEQWGQLYILLGSAGQYYTKVWAIGGFGTNVSGKDYCSLYHGWDMASRGSTKIRSDNLRTITSKEYKLFLSKWQSADNLRKAMIVVSFDKRKNKRKPPNPKSTSIT